MTEEVHEIVFEADVAKAIGPLLEAAQTIAALPPGAGDAGLPDIAALSSLDEGVIARLTRVADQIRAIGSSDVNAVRDGLRGLADDAAKISQRVDGLRFALERAGRSDLSGLLPSDIAVQAAITQGQARINQALQAQAARLGPAGQDLPQFFHSSGLGSGAHQYRLLAEALSNVDAARRRQPELIQTRAVAARRDPVDRHDYQVAFDRYRGVPDDPGAAAHRQALVADVEAARLEQEKQARRDAKRRRAELARIEAEEQPYAPSGFRERANELEAQKAEQRAAQNRRRALHAEDAQRRANNRTSAAERREEYRQVRDDLRGLGIGEDLIRSSEALLPRLKNDIADQATAHAAEVAGMVDAAGVSRLARRPANASGGEWDFWSAIDPSERSRLSQRGWVGDGGLQPDLLADHWNQFFRTDLTVDEVMAEWLERTRLVDAPRALAQGKFPSSSPLGGADPDHYIQAESDYGILNSTLFGNKAEALEAIVDRQLYEGLQELERRAVVDAPRTRRPLDTVADRRELSSLAETLYGRGDAARAPLALYEAQAEALRPLLALPAAGQTFVPDRDRRAAEAARQAALDAKLREVNVLDQAEARSRRLTLEAREDAVRNPQLALPAVGQTSEPARGLLAPRVRVPQRAQDLVDAGDKARAEEAKQAEKEYAAAAKKLAKEAKRAADEQKKQADRLAKINQIRAIEARTGEKLSDSDKIDEYKGRRLAGALSRAQTAERKFNEARQKAAELADRDRVRRVGEERISQLALPAAGTTGVYDPVDALRDEQETQRRARQYERVRNRAKEDVKRNRKESKKPFEEGPVGSHDEDRIKRHKNAQAAKEAEKLRLLVQSVNSMRKELGFQELTKEQAQDEARLLAESKILNQRLNAIREKRVRDELRAAGLGGGGGGGGLPPLGGGFGVPGGEGGYTRFQRLFARLNGTDPFDSPKLGQFVARRSLSVGSFAASSLAIYGGGRAIVELVKDAEALEEQLNILESQYEALEIAGELPKTRAAINDIAKATGISTVQSAQLAIQFTGAFRDAEGAAVDTALAAERIAAELAVIADLEPSEVFNDLVASARAFDATGTAQGQLEALDRLGDLALQARNLSGVPAKEIFDFLGRTGPIARTSGLELTELNAIGAALLQGSGVGGAGLGEQLGRILTEFGPTSISLIEEIQDNEAFRTALRDPNETLDRLYEGDASALFDVIEASEGLSDTQRRALVDSIGGRREGPTLAALLQNGQTALAVRDAAPDADNTRAEEFERKLETLDLQFDQFTSRVEQLGIKIFESGLADALGGLIDLGELAVTALEGLLSAFDAFNDATGGLAAEVLLAAAAVKTLAVSATALKAVNTFIKPTGAGGGGLLGGVPILPTGGRGVLKDFGRGRAGAGGLVGGLGAVGTGLRGVAGSNAGIAIAAVGLASVNEAVQAERQRQRESRSYIQGEVRARLDEGKSFDEVENLIRAQKKPGFGAQLGFAIGGTEGPIGEALSELERAREESLDPTGRRVQLLTGMSDEDLASFVQDDPTLISQDRELASFFAQVDQLRSEGHEINIDSAFVAGRSRKLLSQYSADGSKNSEFGKLALDRVASSSDPEILQALLDIEASEKAKSEFEVALEATFGEGEVGNFNEALAGFEAGTVRFDQLRPKLEQRIKNLKETAAGFSRKGESEQAAEILAEATKWENELAGILDNRYSQQFEFEDLLANIQGETPEAGADRMLERLRLLQSDESASTSQKLGVVQELLALEQEAFDAFVDAAETEAEAMARFSEGFEIPEEARQLLAEVKVELPQVADEIALFADLAGQDIAAVSDLMRQVLLGVAGGADKIIEIANNEMGWLFEGAGLAASFGGDVDMTEITGMVQELGGVRDRLLGFADEPDEVIPTRGGNKGTSPADEAAKKRDEGPTAEEIAMARLRRDEALANGDQVRLAEIAQERAGVMKRYAENAVDEYEAQAAAIEAAEQYDDALAEQAAAFRDLALARSGDDPIEAARNAIKDAQRAIDDASGPTELAQAEAAKIRAQRGLTDAIRDAFNAQIELLQALAEQQGDSVEVAELGLKAAERALTDGIKSGLPGSEIDRLEADVVRARSSRRDAILAEERALIDFQLEMEQITIGQAIAGLQSLISVAGNNDDLVRELNLEIKRLRDQAGQDFQFNLPSELALPTLYEVRRLNQSSNTGPGGGAGYNDNRQINIQVNAQTNATPEDIAQAVADVVGEPTRSGTAVKRY